MPPASRAPTRSPPTPDRAPPPADAIVVLGCAAAGRLKRRLERGVRLYQDGAAPLLLLSGGGIGKVPEAETMRRMALARGIPKAALLIEPRSRDTIGNARECARLLRRRGLRSVILVSDRTHLPRAALLFRLAGLEIVGRSGVPAPALLSAAGAILREAAAMPWSLARALFRRRAG